MFQILTLVTFGAGAGIDRGGRAVAMETLQFPTRADADTAFEQLRTFNPPYGTFSALKLYQE